MVFSRRNSAARRFKLDVVTTMELSPHRGVGGDGETVGENGNQIKVIVKLVNEGLKVLRKRAVGPYGKGALDQFKV